jgi:hypothetical protein
MVIPYLLLLNNAFPTRIRISLYLNDIFRGLKWSLVAKGGEVRRGKAGPKMER